VTPKGPPRVRGLILALIAVLLVMGYAFWRAAAGPRASDQGRANQLVDPPAAPSAGAAPSATPAGSVPTAAAPPPDASVTASGGGGQRATPPSTKSTATAPHAMNETQLMARLRAVKDSDPAAAVTLARDGNRRFPDSADAPERTSILIHALVATDKGSEARGEAEQMVNHYPDSSWVREVERFTGAHRHRAVGVNDAGQVIFR